ncbi:MAG: phospholipid carrier-dependent glycosyltransferase [bacterium]
MSERKYGFFLILAVFAVYFNSLPNDFIFDDVPLVQNSLNVLNMNFWTLVSSYRPLRYISYALDYKLFGMNPWGFRLMNIFYHSLTVLSVFWMLKVFGFSKRGAFLSALIFAIHPVNTDAVAYISGRRDVLMGLFYVLSVGFFMKFYNGSGFAAVEAWKRGSVEALKCGKDQSVAKNGCSDDSSTITPCFAKATHGRHLHDYTTPRAKDFSPLHRSLVTVHSSLSLLLSLFFMFLSISSKEMGATIPLVFILYVIYKDGKKLFAKKWFYIIVMSSLLLFSFFAFIAVSGGGSALVSLEGINFHGNSPKVHYLTAATIWLHYLKLAVFPLKLILDNAGFPLVLDWNFHVFFSVLSMFIYGWVVWRMMMSGAALPPLPFFLVFFVISLAPVLQIIPLHEIVAVHYLYVPVIGFCAIIGALFESGGAAVTSDQLRVNGEDQLTGHSSLVTRNFSLIFLILLLSLFSIRTITRNFELKDITTALHADEKWQPLSFRGYFTLGAQYIYMNFPDKAVEYYEKAVATGYWDGTLLANIIGYHIVKGNHAAALSYYEEMTKKGEFISSAGVLNVAVLYMINGDCEKAVRLATSFSPLSNQVKRIELVKKCETYGFERFDDTDLEDINEKQLLMKELGLEVERKPYLVELVEERSGHSSLVTGHSSPLLDLIRELAVVNLQSDIPQAIKYYKLEKELREKLGLEVPEIVEKSIATLEEHQEEVTQSHSY